MTIVSTSVRGPDRSMRFAAAWAPLSERLSWAARWRGIIAQRRDELARVVSEEIGKTPFEAMSAEVLALLEACAFHERRAGRLLAERGLWGVPRLLCGGLGPFGLRQRVARAPLGRVGIIATWNYPVGLLGVQVLQALLGGNRVVVKPSELAPRSLTMLMESAIDAGLPAGVLTSTAATREAGPALLAEGGAGGSCPLDHLVFTGSTAVGRTIAAWGAANLVATTLELSGRDSAFVLDDADAVLAAKSLWNGVTMHSGQTCMAPRRILVMPRAYEAFVAALAPLVAGAAPRRVISAAAAERCYDLCAQAAASGGRSVTGVMERPTGGDCRSLRPMAIVDCGAETALARGEHFGPVVAVVAVRSLDEALAIHEECDQHLSCSLFTRKPGRVRELVLRLGATNVLVNDSVLPTGSPAVGIGGVAASGWGMTRGAEGLMAMTRPVYVSQSGSRVRLPMMPPTPKEERALDWIVGLLHGRKRP